MDSQQKFAEYRKSTLGGFSFWRRMLRNAPFWISLIANVLTIFVVLAVPFIFAQEIQAFAALFVLVVIVVLSLVAAFGFYWRSLRNSAYAYAMHGLHQAVHILRNEMSSETWDERRVKTVLQKVLSRFAESFCVIVDAPCRTCIKVIAIIPPEGKTEEDIPENERIDRSYARTFCRDEATLQEIGSLPESPTENPVPNNTAFRRLFEDAGLGCWTGNDLPHKKTYVNTSMHKYGPVEDDSWPLPYRAAMVWPIRVITDQARPSVTPGHFTGQQDIIGYLAVDTVATNVFREYIDFHVGALLADALYIFLDRVIPETSTPNT